MVLGTIEAVALSVLNCERYGTEGEAEKGSWAPKGHGEIIQQLDSWWRQQVRQ